MADVDAMLKALETPAQASNNLETLKRLTQLEALGDLRPGERALLDELRKGEAQSRATVGETGARYRGALQGATFQQADEIYGLFGGDKAAAREANRQAETQYPDAFGSGRLAGAAVTGAGLGVATAPLATGAGLLGTMARGAALGAGEGAMWGAGGAEGYGAKASEAGRSGLLGGLLGGAAPALVAGVGAGARAVGDVVGGALGLWNRARGQRAVLGAVAKSGQSLPEVTRAIQAATREGQPEFRVMDALGAAGMRQASGVTRSGGPGAEELSQYLMQRQADQGDRISGFVEKAFEGKGTTAEKTKALLKENRGRTADAMYEAARQENPRVDIRDAVSVIDSRIGGMRGSNISGDTIDGKLQKFRNRLIADPAPNGEISRELSDFDRVLGVKQDLQDEISAALRAGRNNEYRELKKLERALDGALEDASDLYRFANDNFREATRVMDAVDVGAQAANRGRAADNVGILGNMTDQQKKAARIGYGDTLIQEIERNKAAMPNAARVLGSTKRQVEAEALATDPALLQRQVNRENTMFGTFNRALGGSRTADNLQDIQDTGTIGNALRAARDTLSGNVGGVLASATDTLARIGSGYNAATRKEMARILMSKNPEGELAKALKAKNLSETRRRALEGVARAIGRESQVSR